MKDLPLAIIGLVALIIMVLSVVKTLDTPILVKSHTTGQCMYWEDASGKHSCNTAPKEYELVWGE